jgi:Flp pilus assembly pilin Flp
MPSLFKLKHDARGVSLVEYLLVTGAVAIVLIAGAMALQAGYADALINRSDSAMGVQP